MAYSLIRFFVLCIFASGCSTLSILREPEETVLTPGMKISAINKNGEFSIRYVDSHRREFGWNGETKIVGMYTRPERYSPPGDIESKGYLGLYNPATGRAKVRLVVQEALKHFSTEDNVYRFLRQGSAVNDWVYTDDGLMVGFSETPSRNQMNIEVWQILLNGEKPTGLRGSRPENISITFEGSD